FNTSVYGARVLVCTPAGRLDPGASVKQLARALSRERRAVLIDCSGRAMVGLPGLSDMLNGDANFADIIHRDEGSRLHIVGTGSSRVEIDADLDEAVDALSQTYEFVFLVAPQFDDSEIALRLAPAADFALIAVVAAVAGDEAVQLQNDLRAAGAGSTL